MITHQIKGTQPEYTPYTGTPSATPHMPVPLYPTTPRQDKFMEKIAYAKWIEEEVKADWKMGDLCTYRHAPIVMGQLPEMIFQVNHIQEIHYMAPRDDADGFPKCLGVKTSKYDVPMNYSPKNLRHLTEEELNLVRLRDSKPTEKSAGAVEVVVGGQSVYVDGDTGEVL